MDEDDIALGMNRPITRRDFFQGMAVGASALGARGHRPRPKEGEPKVDPPELQGLRGQHPSAMALGHRVRDGELAELRDFVETGESYDLAVVGAGIAGLAAAFVFQKERKPDPTILLLDNHDDFGGHARRNVFDFQGTRLVGPGGTYALESPESSPAEAKRVLDELGIDLERMVAFRDGGFNQRFGLSSAVVFDSRVFPGAKTTWANRWYEVPYEEFFARAPISEEGRRELVELYTTRKDYLDGASNRDALLSEMSWESFIREKMGLSDDAVRFANLYATDLIGLGADAASALDAFEVGPGFYGMGGEGFHEVDGILRYAYEPIHRYPDGNHTIARHLLKALLPQALSGPDGMEGVFNARVHYGRFDREGQRVRLRLRSMVERIEHDGGERSGTVSLFYTREDGKLYRAQARHVVMSGWGSVAKHILPELPHEQRQALDEYRYSSAIYINLMLRHWRPIADLGWFEAFWPDGYCTWMHIADPLRVGDYRPTYHPDRPTLLSMYKYIYKPGLDPVRQMELGRYEMEQKSFESYEREIRRELTHILGPFGFDSAEDIVGLTLNRWGHGYNYFKAPRPWSKRAHPPYESGRRRLGRISFGGADAGGSPWTQAAIAQAWRAAQEQLEID
ncbi:MAG TPA: FAD-dependent oxidoreductase [Vicinamibacteria bacterium]|nr:FAD-dependent oxidoreductase [Vicinamibacteria bacterium]